MNIDELHAPTILVVDDNPDNLSVLFTSLTKAGFTVLTKKDGESALNVVAKKQPDIILLDILMPDLDGFEVCCRLKNNEKTRDIPVIFMSALSDTVDKIRGFQVGGVDYITKPFHYEEVLARVNAHLMIRKLQQELKAQHATLEAQHTKLQAQHQLTVQLNAQLTQEIRERRQAESELAVANLELQRLAALDGLTHLANRRRFDEYLAQEWNRMAREQKSLSLILCDIDYFKRYNDSYGHQAGDQCLQQIAERMSGVIHRPADVVARYGGEEFVIVLPNTNAEGAMHIARSLQHGIRLLQIPHAQSSVDTYVTLSMGVTATVPQPGTSADILVEMADNALYEAKARGRNLIVFKNLSL